MRERLVEGYNRARLTGITPAYAGKTFRLAFSLWSLWDHPRVCGKDIVQDLNDASFAGSPPRMRERLDKAGINVNKSGITPAYAGKTSGHRDNHRDA